MDSKFLEIEDIINQEILVKNQTEDFFGKGRNGFCDFSLDGINLLIKGVLYLRNEDKFENTEKWNDFNHAFRTFSYYHYYRIIFIFKATYNLFLNGYYTEAAILMRHVIETFVRLRYIDKKEEIELVDLAFAGHRGFNNKKYNISYKTQFDEIAPNLYEFYRTLCDIAHGSISAHLLKTNLRSRDSSLNPGVTFKPYESSFISNQYSVYLLAHLEFMVYIFPEIKLNMSESDAEKYHSLVALLWRIMSDISKREQNKKWYNAVKQIVKV